MTLEEAEDRVFDKYSPKPIRDGALSLQYESSNRRLLLILKEVNDPKKWFEKNDGDLRKFPHENRRAATWDNVARWSALFQNPSLDLRDVDVSTLHRRSMHLQSTSFVNLKKTAGGRKSSLQTIEKYAEEHWNLLREQIQLYKPTCTISCGVFDILKLLYDATPVPKSGSCFKYFEHQDLGVCIDFYHPAYTYRLSNLELFEMLRDQFNHHGFRIKDSAYGRVSL